MSTGDKVKKVLTGAAALGALVQTELNVEHDEIDRFQVAGVPLFWRDQDGRPRVLGLPFRRWLRGPRKNTGG